MYRVFQREDYTKLELLGPVIFILSLRVFLKAKFIL